MKVRLKHVPGAHERVEASKYVIHDPARYRGHFRDLFANDHPIYVEIGMGKGAFLIENAKRNPNINFIGIEKFDSVIVKAVEKIEEYQFPNVYLIRMDATQIETIFDHEIDLIYLNFSDPWPKKRHAHRRLSSPLFLKRYQSLFKGQNTIEMKTDNRQLFEYSIMSFTEFGFHIEDISLHLHEDNVMDNIPTEYELKFLGKGFPIYKIRITKED